MERHYDTTRSTVQSYGAHGANVDECVSSKAIQAFAARLNRTIFRNASSKSAVLRQIYLDAFDGTPDYLRMALLDPLVVNGNRSKWYGVGGSSTLGYSDIPTVG